MTVSVQVLSATEAARRLGVSAKALRLYEERGLLTPQRTEAGWRAYGPDVMQRASEVAALRGLGFSLTQVQRVLAGEREGLEPALAAHQSRLEEQLAQLEKTVGRVRAIRSNLYQDKAPTIAELARIEKPDAEPVVAFDLPWPWGGERFELRELRPINFIVGALGSGKTRLARRLAEELPGGKFVGLERLEQTEDALQQMLEDDPRLSARVESALAWLVEEGAEGCHALRVLVTELEREGDGALVIDTIEQGLDEAAQRSIAAYLRRRGPTGRTVFAMTRSCAILDLGAVGPNELILHCPANHSPPTIVAPLSGAPGYEAVATCLATPAVRLRTQGMIVSRAVNPA